MNNRWVIISLTAAAWILACFVTWQMPLATRVAVGLTATAVMLIVTVKASSARR